MRTPKTTLLLCTALLSAVISFEARSFAQLVAYDDAANYYKSANWTNGANQGFGFGPWAFVTNNTATPQFHGLYIGNGYAMGQSTNVASVSYTNLAWGIYANGSGGVNETMACRSFASPLGTNTFKVQWAAKGAGATTVTGVGTVHGWCGFTLRNGNETNTTGDFQTGARFYLYFLDGASPSTIYVGDGSANSPISLTGTSFSDLGRGWQGTPAQAGTNAVQAELTVGPDGEHYHLVLKDIVRNKTLYTLDSVLGGSGSVDSVALFVHETSGGGSSGGVSFNGDQNYNRMQISVPSLVPPTIVNVQPTNGSVYVDAGVSVPITFEVDSFNSTVASNFVTLSLNGVAQSNRTFNTTGPTTQLFATYNPTLAPNTLYTCLITAQDANGNIVTNTSTFNTFLAGNLYIDASDYNYNGGQYIDNLAPTNGYGGLAGVNGIDFLDYTGTNVLFYRTFPDQPQILDLNFDATGDPNDHAGERANGFTVFNIGFTDIGEWQNFTRTVPGNTNYAIYARVASTTGGQFEIDLLANATATTSNQPYAALGRVNFPATGGSKTFNGQLTPVTDLFGNTVIINLSGTKTFRETSLANRIYNLEYFTLVPVTNATTTLRPYLSTASPIPNATGVLLDSPVTFTVANRQTTVTNIQLSVNAIDVSGSLTTSNNGAGTTVSYLPATYLPSNATNKMIAIITDSAGIKLTNTWSFLTVNVVNTVLPGTNAQASAGGPGFALRVYKAEDAAPTTATLANAEMELSGTRTNIATSLPYPNLALGPNNDGTYTETNTINYDITGAPTGTPAFNSKSPMPNVPSAAVNNNIAIEALTYLQLNTGSYHFQVRSDDGFKLTSGPTAGDTNIVLGFFDGGRGNGTATDIYFTVTNSGYYPMRLLYYQAGSGGNVEFYSLSNNVPILINDPSNPNSIKAFLPPAALAGVTLFNPARSGNTVTFSFLTQASHTHYVEYKNDVTDVSWTPLQTVTGNGSITNITDASASGSSRFYHVRTQ